MRVEDCEFEKVEGGYALTKYTKDGTYEVTELERVGGLDIVHKYERSIEKVDSATIPDRYLGEPVVEIRERAFQHVFFIKKIVIPPTVTTLCDRCFLNFAGLVEIFIPDTVRFLGSAVFECCGSLELVRLPSHITELPSEFFLRCASLETVVLPDKVTNIQKAAFQNCFKLVHIQFSQALERIEADAFLCCRGVKQLHLPDTLRELGDRCFTSCEKLEEIYFQELEMSCGKAPFEWCKSLKKVPMALVPYVEKTTKNQVAQEFFLEFEHLSPEEQEKLLSYVKQSTPLRQFLFTLPNSQIVAILLRNQIQLTLEEVDAYLAKSMEKGCMEINAMFLNYKEKHFSKEEREEYQQKRDLQEMGFERPSLADFGERWALQSTSDGIYIRGYHGVRTSEHIITSFGEEGKIVALKRGKNADYFPLEHITMESGLQEIGEECFSNHTHLKTVELPPDLLWVDERTFYGCTSLEEITIPESVMWIKTSAFYQCSSLKKVIFLGEIPFIDNDVFRECTSLTYIGKEDGLNLLSQFTI